MHNYNHRKDSRGLFLIPTQAMNQRKKELYVTAATERGKREQSAKFRQSLVERGSLHNKMKEALNYNRSILGEQA